MDDADSDADRNSRMRNSGGKETDNDTGET